MTSVEERIRDYIAKNILFSDDGYSNDDSFLEEGIIDSMGIIELVTFVDEGFGLEVDDEELVPDNFDSISKLAAYIRRKSPAMAVA